MAILHTRGGGGGVLHTSFFSKWRLPLGGVHVGNNKECKSDLHLRVLISTACEAETEIS